MRHFFTEEILRNMRKSWIMLTALTVLSVFHYMKTFIFEGCKHDVEVIPSAIFRKKSFFLKCLKKSQTI